MRTTTALQHMQAPRKDRAVALAQSLLKNPHIERVELFGSFARGEETAESDVDMIIVVRIDIYYKWLACLNREHDWRSPGVYAHGMAGRNNTACELLGISLAMSEPYVKEVDVFLFPEDWQERLDELQSHLPHEDKNFMRNIAADAYEVASRQENSARRNLRRARAALAKVRRPQHT